MTPSYISLSTQDFQYKIKTLNNILHHCTLCPRHCKIDRYKKKGYCNSGVIPGIASYNLHFGEEPPISGTRGSGAIFFHHCTLNCLYCQNYPISQLHSFPLKTPEELADIFLNLQSQKAHNINLVTPTHFIPSIVEAIYLARENGLTLPFVYNSSGYESLEILKIIEHIFDIYLLDMKYSDNELAKKLSDVSNYVPENRKSIQEAFKQVGLLKTDKHNIAYKGLIIRHLVLPGYIQNSKSILKYIAQNISEDSFVSIMSQYFPAYKAVKHPILNKKLSNDEYNSIIEYALSLNLKNSFIQEMDTNENDGTI